MFNRFFINKILNVISSPLLLAIPITVLILWLFPPIFDKYKVEISSRTLLNNESKTKQFFVDTDNDNYSELVHIYMHRNISTSVVFLDYNSSTIGQVNFPGFYIETLDLLKSDYDNNNFSEVYIFTHTDSFLYINSAELTGKDIIEKRKFVTKFDLHQNKPDVDIHGIGSLDLNSDGFKEILFSVIAGFSLQPRAIFAYDVKNDTILRSPKSYAALSMPFISDLDNDKTPEIISSTWSPGNTNPEIHKPYHDQSAWLMIFDNKLKFKYDPIEFPGFTSRELSYLIKYNNRNYLLVYWYRKLAGNELMKARVYDSELKLITEKEWPVSNKVANNQLLVNQTKKGNKVWFVNIGDGKAEQLDLMSLETVKSIDIYPYQQGSILLDVDNNEEKEILLFSNDNRKLHIYRSDFSDAVTLHFDDDEYAGRYFSIRKNGESNPQFSFHRGSVFYIVNYSLNKIYYFKYPFYLLVYLVFVLFIYLIKYTQTRRIEEKYQTEKQISELQIRTIKNQADPHFIFNTLNSIGSIIYKEDKDTAYNYLNDFSSLIRRVIINSDKIRVTLEEELEFVSNYLKLEKLRFKDKFDYEIKVDKLVDMTTQVPRMVLQTYIENAIKHGIMHLETNGLLKIDINKDVNYVVLTIEDNGIGREKAKEYNNLSTGKGLEIMEKIYGLYSKLYKIEIIHNIEDIKEDLGNPLGTRVTVKIPTKSGR